MPHILKNKKREVHIDLPTENYKRSRFDWTGKIVEVIFNRKYLSGIEIADLAEEMLCGKGFYNEFGIESSLKIMPLKLNHRKREEGKNKFSVLNAVKNKLIHRVYAVVNRGTPYVELSRYAQKKTYLFLLLT